MNRLHWRVFYTLLSVLTACCSCDSGGLSMEPYVSPGSFYAPGELTVSVTRINRLAAPAAMDVYAPVEAGRYPVVIFQHGFMAPITVYETIVTHLAGHGFIVVVPRMYPPGSYVFATTPEQEARRGYRIILWVKSCLGRFLAVDADTALLGLAGHSRGGQAAYRMALLAPQHVAALAGVDPVDALEIFGQNLIITGPLSFAIPTFILGTGLGPVVPDETEFDLACAPEEIGHNHFYAANPGPSWHMVAVTHGHSDMLDEEDFVPLCPGGPDRDGMRALTGGALAAFFSGTLQGNTAALSVLTDPEAAPVPVEVESK